MENFKEKIRELRGTYFSFEFDAKDYPEIKKQLEEEGISEDVDWNEDFGKVLLENHDSVYIIIMDGIEELFAIHNHEGVGIKSTFKYN